MTDDHPGMLPEGDRKRAGAASPTEPVFATYANSGLLAIAPLGSPHPADDPSAWVIIYEQPPGWAGPGFTRRNEESAPPTLATADPPPPATQGDDPSTCQS
jgi:hypothetical protein